MQGPGSQKHDSEWVEQVIFINYNDLAMWQVLPSAVSASSSLCHPSGSRKWLCCEEEF